MKNVFLALALLLLSGFVHAQAVPEVVDDLKRAIDAVGDDDWGGPGSLIRQAINAMEGKKDTHITTTLTVVIANFTYAQTGLGSPFSRFLEDQFSAALVQSKYFSLFPRDVLTNLPSGTQASFRDQLGGGAANGSLSGKFSPGKDGAIVVDFQLADLEKGRVIGYGQVTVPANRIPAKVAIEPPPAPVVPPMPASPAPEPSVAASDRLSVVMTTDRGQAGTYFDNEELTVSIFANKDCWVKIYQVDGEGDVKLIFPNPYSSGNKVAANTRVRIPDGTAGFAFSMGPPYGVETLRVVASTVPFQANEVPFESLGKDAGQVLTRGLTVKSKTVAAEMAQAQVQYTVQPTPY